MSRQTRKHNAKKRARSKVKSAAKAAAAVRTASAPVQGDVLPVINADVDAMRSAVVRADTVDKQTRTVEAVLATESPVEVLDLRSWERIDEILMMSGCRVPKQIPLIDTHDRSTIDSMRGSVRDIRVEGELLIGVLNVSASEPNTWTKIEERHVTDNSVGYHIYDFVMIEPGATHEIDGKTFQAGAERSLRIATDWEPKEDSLCPIGADTLAKLRSRSRHLELELVSRKETVVKTEFEKYLEARGLKADALTEQQLEVFQADFDALEEDGERAAPAAAAAVPPVIPEAAPKAETPEEIAVRVQTEERTRCSSIRAEGGDLAPEIIEKCIVDGTSLADARGIFLAKIRERTAESAGSPEVTGGGNAALEQVDDDMLKRAFTGEGLTNPQPDEKKEDEQEK